MSAPADVIAEIYARLDFQRTAGGLLEGWTFERQPVEVVQGSADKPSLHLSMPTLNESQTGSAMARPLVRIMFAVSSRRESTRKGADAIVGGLQRHCDEVEFVRNSIEQDTTGERDVMMAGLLIEPLRWESVESRINSDSFGTGMQLVLPLRAVLRGTR